MRAAERLAGGLVALASCLLALAGPARGGEPRPLRFGLNDLQYDHADPARALTLHQRLGATIQRVGLPWRSVQPTAVSALDWSYPDRLYRDATRRGMRPLFVLGQTPAWAATRTFVPGCFLNGDAPGCERPPAADKIPQFQRFVGEAARRYPRAAAIEVFNEPNLGNYNWQPGADPAGYAGVLRATYLAVKNARPELPVLLGGLTFPPAPLQRGMIGPREFLEGVYAAGGKGAMDGVALHPYPGGLSPAASPGRRLAAETRAVTAANGDSGLPLWFTELGYTTKGDIAVSLADQAAWLPQLVDDAFKQPDVAAVVVNTLADTDAQTADGGYGLTFRDLSPKPVFGALARKMSRIRDLRSAAACRCSRRAVRCARKKSRSRSCRKARARCRCVRRWRACVRRGSNSRGCRRAKRCARCAQAGVASLRCYASRDPA